MKKILILALGLLTFTATNAQFGLNVGWDAKIGIFGTDNEYTDHDGVANYQVKAEYIDGRDTYFALGYKYVNLETPYRAAFANLGVQYTLNESENLAFIPQLEVGQIHRGGKLFDNHGAIYGQGNAVLRWYLSQALAFEGQGYLQLARDLPDRTFRWGGNIAIVYRL